ncbi:unnamed protein product [Arabidopsis halleri]
MLYPISLHKIINTYKKDKKIKQNIKKRRVKNLIILNHIEPRTPLRGLDVVSN